MHVQREREARRIAAENERTRTEQQMEAIRARKPKDEKEKPGLLSRAIGAFKPAEPTERYRKPVAESYRELGLRPPDEEEASSNGKRPF